jgi:general stress protein 26
MDDLMNRLDDTATPRTDTHQHLFELIHDFDTAMLITHTEGVCHARPMAVAEIREGADAYFATHIDSPKIAEIEDNPRVLVTMQSRSEYAAINGDASIVRDRAEIARLWKDTWKVWFPGGKDDPKLCLLKVTADHGEYWDNSGTEGLKYLFEGAKAVLQGRTPDSDAGQHAKVDL